MFGQLVERPGPIVVGGPLEQIVDPVADGLGGRTRDRDHHLAVIGRIDQAEMGQGSGQHRGHGLPLGADRHPVGRCHADPGERVEVQRDGHAGPSHQEVDQVNERNRREIYLGHWIRQAGMDIDWR
ncbi:MAG: hypothetical protein A2W31_13430 [Planctomycetes bacterium RBG_16_64_10]|nr:MAG: hypothetical protein A2W31_13430 [Planctomycetes bacterium RBG_16_64_10]